ncbi:MAG: DUF373 family protein [Candidatus ainarchaeum sp.]|nr:DUF373 family protein [Candidatus ainarchaeum sp.]
MVETIVLCIDRDNDLSSKAGIGGPIVGRKNNLNAATKLALSDPEDVDANAMFYAIKLYDSLLKSRKSVEIITITGDKKLGYKADKEISNQLDRVVRELGALSCVLVSDGASDEEVMPIIKSRIKIDSNKIVYVKQAKELEKTYYVILEKLKDPYYAKIILGVPALFLLLISLSSYSGVGWQPIGIVVGLYLLFLKGFGWEEKITDFFKDLNFSFERVSWVANVSAIIIFVLSLLVAGNAYNTALNLDLYGEKMYSYILSSITSLLLFSALFVVLGKSIDSIQDKKHFMITRYAVYAIAFVLLALILDIGSNWITNIREPYISFGEFFSILIISLFIAWVSTIIIGFIRTNSLLSLKMEGKEVINTNGGFVGRIVGVDGANGTIIIQNVFDRRMVIPFDSVFSVSDQVVVQSIV